MEGYGISALKLLKIKSFLCSINEDCSNVFDMFVYLGRPFDFTFVFLFVVIYIILADRLFPCPLVINPLLTP